MRSWVALGFAIVASVACRSDRSTRTAEPQDPIPATESTVDHSAARELLAAANRDREKGDVESARVHLGDCIDLLIAAPAGTGELLVEAGVLASELGFASEALTSFRNACSRLERELSADHVEVQRARARLAALLAESGDLAGALEVQTAMLESCERTFGVDDLRTLRTRGNLAGLLFTLGQHQAALDHLNQLMPALERTLPAEDRDVQRTRMFLGIVYHAMGDLTAARAQLEPVIEVLERTATEGDLELADARSNLGVLFIHSGDFDGARSLFEQALAAREAKLPPEHPEIHRTRGNLANVLRETGDFEAAISLDEAVAAQLARILPEDHPDVVEARHNLGATLYHLGDLERARAAQEWVLAARERTLPPDHPDLTLSRQNLATTLLSLGDAVQARAQLEEVLAQRERVVPDDHPDLLLAKRNLSLALCAMNECGIAFELQQSVLAALERTLPEDHPRICDAREALAETLKQRGDLESARRELERVLAARARAYPDDHVHIAQARMHLSGTLLQLGELSDARDLAERALAAFVKSLPADDASVLFARVQIVRCAAALGDWSTAARELRATASSMRAAISRARSLPAREARELAQWLDRAATPLLSWHRDDPEIHEQTFAVVEGLRAVSAREDGRASYRDSHASALRARVAQRQRKIGELLSARADADASTSALAELVRARDRAELELVANSPPVPVIEREAIARALPPGAAAVGYRRYHHEDPARRTRVDARWVAHVVRSDATLVRVDLGSARAIDDAIAAWRTDIGAGAGPSRGQSASIEAPTDAEAEQSSGSRLRELVLDPVLAAAGDADAFFACLDAELHLVPLDALPLGDGSEVGDRIPIHIETSFARLLAPAPARDGSATLLAVGGLEFSDGGPSSFEPLPGSMAEVLAVAELFRDSFGAQPRVMSGKEGSKAAVSEAMASARFIHVATHGWFADTLARPSEREQPAARSWAPLAPDIAIRELAPMTLCGLALAGAGADIDGAGSRDGVLTAEELAAFDLSRCELAVLSACETSVGVARSGQAVQSLQAASRAAGVSSAITSLWPVHDERTRELFDEFYRGIWTRGESRADALWNAKSALRRKGYPVRDWGAWVLTGDPE